MDPLSPAGSNGALLSDEGCRRAWRDHPPSDRSENPRIELGFVCVVMWAVEHPMLGRLKPDCNDRNLQLFDLSLALAPVANS
jgi:hypothetical protein